MAGFFNKLFKGKDESFDHPDYSAVVTDIHSHLIPGIDDGSPTLEHSIQMIRELQSIGFKNFVTTPHVMSDAYPNTQEKIREGIEILREQLDKENIKAEIQGAAEYYLDEWFEDQLDREIPLLTFGGEKRYLLFETSYMNKPLSLNTLIFKMNSQGYTPILAHPERYTFVWGDSDLEQLTQIYEKGVKFQVNIGSFAGSYSKRAGKVAVDLFEAGMIDFLGTDFHSTRQKNSLIEAFKLSKELRELIQSPSLLNKKLSIEN